MRASLPQIDLLRSGNCLVVSPTPEPVLKLLSPALSYTEKIFYRGKELAVRRRAGLSAVEEMTWQCYGFDRKERLVTNLGFAEKVRGLLQGAGYAAEIGYGLVAEAQEARNRLETVYRPRWDRIDSFVKGGYAFRHKQREALECIAQFECGRISCPPGWGKGDTIMLACMLYPKAKIAVVTRRKPVLLQRLYPALALNLPSVGIVTSGKTLKGRRVMCYTAGSLAHCDENTDFLFFDEGHEACSDNCAEFLGRFRQARMWAFSASWDMRLDNKDLRGEALFGPLRFEVTYAEAEEHGMVSPIEIIWSSVDMRTNPCEGLQDSDKKAAGIWTNDFRNQIIAKDAKLYADDVQVQISVETIEHALNLKRFLPDFELVYDGQGLSHGRIKYFRKEGLVDRDWQPLTPERRADLTARFERGRLKKAIATTVWNVGVNFTKLDVLIRADAGGSPINDTQIPGRNSRINDQKIAGIVHDYCDEFDTGFAQKAGGRRNSYEKHGWTQNFPKNRAEKRQLLRRLLGWEDEL